MEHPLATFYRGKTVLVTGHTGFKGGWLAAWLKLLGARVIGYALEPDTEPNLFRVAAIADGMVSLRGDIRDLDAVTTAFRRYPPDIVIHNAAQALVRRSYRAPVETYETNVMGTVHVLEAARQTPSVRAIVVVTSDKCYQNRDESTGYQESDPLGGYDPYSSSKACAELVTAAYRQSFAAERQGLGIASARAGNVIGGGDWAEDRLVPDLVRGIASGSPVTIRRPDAVRPWQHVLEPLRGYLQLAHCLWQHGPAYAGPWNFGPRDEDAITVADLARRLIARWGEGQLTIQPNPEAPHESSSLRLDTTKARSRLGWHPVLDLDQALAWSAEWYRAYYRNPASAGTGLDAQIERAMQTVPV